MNALIPFPKALESQLIELACAHGLTREELRCHMSMQHGEGSYISKSKGILAGRHCHISYDLYLCQFCGHAIAQDVCPYKARIVAEKLLNA